MASLTAANQARLDKALGRTVRFHDGISTWKDALASGKFSHRVTHIETDGSKVYGFIEGTDAESTLRGAPEGGRASYPGHGDPMQELTFAPYVKCAKMVYEYAENLPEVVTSPTSFEYYRMATDAELAHLFGTA